MTTDNCGYNGIEEEECLEGTCPLKAKYRWILFHTSCKYRNHPERGEARRYLEGNEP